MRGGHLIFPVATHSAAQHSRKTRVVFQRLHPIFDVLNAEIPDKICKTFIEPQIVPPVHRHQVAKPHVRTLMGNHIPEFDHSFSRNCLLVEIVVSEGHNAWVFHGSEFVLMTEDVVVLLEGVLDFELLLVEFDGLYGELEDEIGKVVHEGGIGVEAVERHRQVIVAGVYRNRYAGVLSHSQAVQIGREGFSRREDVELASLGDGVLEFSTQSRVASLSGSLIGSSCKGRHRLTLVGIGNSNPSLRHDDIEINICFEIGLVETGKQPMSSVRLESGVDVGAGRAFSRILKLQAADAVIIIVVGVLHSD